MYSDYSFVFDIDGTICPIKKKDEKYEDLVPYKNVVEKMRYYKENGAKIILFTSRNMNIPYDEIIYGKPWPGHKGFYVDDRTVRPDEFLKHTAEELDQICRDSKNDSK